MADYNPPGREPERLKRGPGGPPPGLDPLSATRFSEIIDADRDNRIYDRRPEPDAAPRPDRFGRDRFGRDLFGSDQVRRDQFSRATWVMIVVAGIVLGFAMAMMAAG